MFVIYFNCCILLSDHNLDGTHCYVEKEKSQGAQAERMLKQQGHWYVITISTKLKLFEFNKQMSHPVSYLWDKLSTNHLMTQLFHPLLWCFYWCHIKNSLAQIKNSSFCIWGPHSWNWIWNHDWNWAKTPAWLSASLSILSCSYT